MGEEIVEKVIPESIIEKHEQWGGLFALLIYITTVLSVIYLFIKEPLRKFARTGLLVLSVLLLGVGAQTGRLGGELVYRHNAASILMNEYENSGSLLASERRRGTQKKRNHDDHDDDHYRGHRDHDDDDHDDSQHRDRDDDSNHERREHGKRYHDHDDDS
jgi:hypothetical protein